MLFDLSKIYDLRRQSTLSGGRRLTMIGYQECQNSANLSKPWTGLTIRLNPINYNLLKNMKSFIFRAIQKSPIYVSVGSSYRIIGGKVEFSVNVSMKDGRSWTVMRLYSEFMRVWKSLPMGTCTYFSNSFPIFWGERGMRLYISYIWAPHPYDSNISILHSFSAIFVTVNDWSANYYYYCKNSSCMVYFLEEFYSKGVGVRVHQLSQNQ